MYEAILYIAVAKSYCVSLVSSIMITIIRHVFINIFQTDHFSTCKICHGLWEKYELPCDSKISKSLKKVEKIGLGSFNSFCHSFLPNIYEY